jgi:hypothetical protein
LGGWRHGKASGNNRGSHENLCMGHKRISNEEQGNNSANCSLAFSAVLQTDRC